MSRTAVRTDLVCLVADNDIRQSILAILARHQALKIRPTSHEILVHPEHDPGCLLDSPNFLRSFLNRVDRALIVFDREGCGRESSAREELETELESRLAATGWRDRAAAVVIDPELESWVWSDSPHVATSLGWIDRTQSLRSWLEEQGFLTPAAIKPERPKAAVEQALRIVRKPRSSAIYYRLAKRVSLARCADPAFAKLRRILATWFPAEAQTSVP